RRRLVEPEDLVRRVPPREAEELGEVAELPARGTATGGGAGNLGPAARGAHEPDRDLHERRLAGAVRAEQADELALLHREIDTLQRADGSVTLLERMHREGRRHAARVRH